MGSIKDFMRGDCSTYAALKKFPLMRVNVEDDAYKHYNSGNGYDNSMRMAEGHQWKSNALETSQFHRFL